MQAAWIRQASKDLKLQLREANHERNIEGHKLTIRQGEDWKALTSGKYLKIARHEAKKRILGKESMGKGRGWIRFLLPGKFSQN